MRKRLDLLLIERGLAPDEIRAQALILAGKVLVNDRADGKAGSLIAEEARIRLKDPPLAWVSRGALKLKAALESHNRDLTGLTCLDVGASTGGFTDVMLAHGAARVFAVDVGHGQLAWKLQTDPRVVVMDRCNIRHLRPEDLPTPVDFLASDISFISQTLALPPSVACLRPDGHGVVLIKPQFELPRHLIDKGGVVRDPGLHEQAIAKVRAAGDALGLTTLEILPSPIAGPAGNREFLYCFCKEPLA
ncbi:MAG: TlyA family RNA methyltransferase [Magnetococcales bacterium]|nr:TlyA family RNA methyltransferase [Magnetococcales bacterium]